MNNTTLTWLYNITSNHTQTLQTINYESTIKNICNGFYNGELTIAILIVLFGIAKIEIDHYARKHPEKDTATIQQIAHTAFDDLSFLFALFLIISILH